MYDPHLLFFLSKYVHTPTNIIEIGAYITTPKIALCSFVIPQFFCLCWASVLVFGPWDQLSTYPSRLSMSHAELVFYVKFLFLNPQWVGTRSINCLWRWWTPWPSFVENNIYLCDDMKSKQNSRHVYCTNASVYL